MTTGYFYIYDFGDIVKIGISDKTPELRLESHLRDLQKFSNAKLLNSKIFETEEYRNIERLAKVRFSQNTINRSYEWIAGVSFDDVVGFVEKYLNDAKGSSIDLLSLSIKSYCKTFDGIPMGDLTHMWGVANIFASRMGEPALDLSKFLKNKSTQKFLEVCEAAQNGKKCLVIDGDNGKGRRTYASIHMMIYAAEHISTQFHYEVIDMLIKHKILEYRDVSGNEFKALNIAIDNYLPDREGKDNRQVYINVARAMRSKVGLKLPSWNEATADQLRARGNVENKLTEMLQVGLINDYDHMMRTLERIKAY